jgi:hypothetical protein
MLQLQLLFNIHPIENMEQILPKKKRKYGTRESS